MKLQQASCWILHQDLLTQRTGKCWHQLLGERAQPPSEGFRSLLWLSYYSFSWTMDAKLISFGDDHISPALPSSGMKKSENMDGGFFSLKHQEKGKNLFAHMCMWSYVHLQWLGESVTQFFKYWIFSICMHLPNKTYRITQNTFTWVLYFFMSVLLKKCEWQISYFLEM